MSLNGIDSVTYGVSDLDQGCRFFADWGLRPQQQDSSGAVFSTLDGAEVVLRPLSDPRLPAAFEPGPTLREMVWGASDAAALDASRKRLSSIAAIETDAAGVSRCTDPNGLTIALRVSQRQAIDVSGAGMNTPGNITRINQAAPVYARAEPLHIGHVVVFTDDLQRLESFYCEGLGFQVSDRYPGRGVFLRCQAEGGHHNLFILQLPTGKVGLNHVAFVVRDIHEVFGGGMHVSRCDWQTEIGPGRHPISSAYFWYFVNPCGGTAEYYADEDYLTADWQPRELQPSKENFAEWAIAGGIDGNTRRQTIPSD